MRTYYTLYICPLKNRPISYTLNIYRFKIRSTCKSYCIKMMHSENKRTPLEFFPLYSDTEIGQRSL